ncbi:MAG: WYL domain-containing protein [Paludibacteraceae bacterium]|nr:WYL domain-containing protein [Paludibacteraceae bacterium]
MKPSLIFRQYTWLVNLLRQYKRLTFEEISNHWIEDEIGDGNPLSRSTFNRHRDALLDMFGIIIECDKNNGYEYYIDNPETLNDNSITHWMLSTLTVNNMLVDSLSLKNKILLENIPNGDQYFSTIIKALKTNHKLTIHYQRFNGESSVKTVAPYTLKLFHQRWYLFTFTGNHYAIYSLDRISKIDIAEETFTMPEDFSPEQYFSEYFGIYSDNSIPMEHIIIRAYELQKNYLQTLPMHHSQRIIKEGENYADFAIDLRPTSDFVSEILSKAEYLEVLEPLWLREEIADKIERMQKNYKKI